MGAPGTQEKPSTGRDSSNSRDTGNSRDAFNVPATMGLSVAARMPAEVGTEKQRVH